MKKARINLISVLIFFGLNASAQYTSPGRIPQGTYYTFVRSKSIEMTFHGDTIKGRTLRADLSEIPGEDGEIKAAIIDSIISAHGYLYYLHTDTLEQAYLGIEKLLDRSRLMSIINVPGKFKSKTEALEYIKTDTTRKFGFIFYSDTAYRRILKAKPVETISKKDFKTFCERVIYMRAEMDTLKKLNNAPTGWDMAFYGYFAFKNILAELGYNPLGDPKDWDKMFDLYKNDPELKELVEKVMD